MCPRHSYHTPEYISRVKAISAANGGEVGEETNIAKGGYEIAALAAGGAITAGSRAHRFVPHPPPPLITTILKRRLSIGVPPFQEGKRVQLTRMEVYVTWDAMGSYNV